MKPFALICIAILCILGVGMLATLWAAFGNARNQRQAARAWPVLAISAVALVVWVTGGWK